MVLFGCVRMMLCAATSLAACFSPSRPSSNPELQPTTSLPSPENQVFQFMASVPVSGMANNSQPCIAYLWIPPTCSYVRGVLIAGRNLT